MSAGRVVGPAIDFCTEVMVVEDLRSANLELEAAVGRGKSKSG
jgi:hypothetical protein